MGARARSNGGRDMNVHSLLYQQQQTHGHVVPRGRCRLFR
jgi:hypothetical protein